MEACVHAAKACMCLQGMATLLSNWRHKGQEDVTKLAEVAAVVVPIELDAQGLETDEDPDDCSEEEVRRRATTASTETFSLDELDTPRREGAQAGAKRTSIIARYEALNFATESASCGPQVFALDVDGDDAIDKADVGSDDTESLS